MIGYYAARRERSIWSTASDIAMVAALLLAPVMVWLSSTMVTDEHLREHVVGRLMTDHSGQFMAQVLPDDEPGQPWPPNTNPVAEFELRVAVQDRGWPVTTSRTVLPPTLEISRFADAETAKDVRFDDSDPELRAIATALQQEPLTDEDAGVVGARWQEHEPERSTHIFGWIFGFALWWVMLFIAMMLMIGIARLGFFIFTAKKHVKGAQFRAEGKCAHCGYDLRGLEFQDRCPECGHLAW